MLLHDGQSRRRRRERAGSAAGSLPNLGLRVCPRVPLWLILPFAPCRIRPESSRHDEQLFRCRSWHSSSEVAAWGHNGIAPGWARGPFGSESARVAVLTSPRGSALTLNWAAAN